MEQEALAPAATRLVLWQPGQLGQEGGKRADEGGVHGLRPRDEGPPHQHVLWPTVKKRTIAYCRSSTRAKESRMSCPAASSVVWEEMRLA